MLYEQRHILMNLWYGKTQLICGTNSNNVCSIVQKYYSRNLELNSNRQYGNIVLMHAHSSNLAFFLLVLKN